jgi:hypothetical protein
LITEVSVRRGHTITDKSVRLFSPQLEEPLPALRGHCLDAGGQRPVVLQLGDFDPSGEDIVRDFRERLMMLSKRDVVFEKVAVTLDQVVGWGFCAGLKALRR